MNKNTRKEQLKKVYFILCYPCKGPSFSKVHFEGEKCFANDLTYCCKWAQILFGMNFLQLPHMSANGHNGQTCCK